MIVVDTHALLWWLEGGQKLSVEARREVEAAEKVLVPAICFWEVALLAQAGRVALTVAPLEWMRLVCSLSRVEAVPLSPDIAVAAVSLAMHPDPADRFIVATALARGAPLVTKDRKLRKLPELRTIW